MNNWEILKARAAGLACGALFETNILGRTIYQRGPSGELEGVIPPELEARAREFGFSVRAVDFKRDTYTLQKLSE